MPLDDCEPCEPLVDSCEESVLNLHRASPRSSLSFAQSLAAQRWLWSAAFFLRSSQNPASSICLARILYPSMQPIGLDRFARFSFSGVHGRRASGFCFSGRAVFAPMETSYLNIQK